jgi:hypothetical protein
MSTHAAIIVKTQDGIYAGAYLHQDGYPAHVGQILLMDFNDQKKAEDLVALGGFQNLHTGGFIKKWEHKDEEQLTVYGATVEDAAKKINAYEVYVFEKGWFHDKIAITEDFRRDPNWTFKGRPLADAYCHALNVRYHEQQKLRQAAGITDARS